MFQEVSDRALALTNSSTSWAVTEAVVNVTVQPRVSSKTIITRQWWITDQTTWRWCVPRSSFILALVCRRIHASFNDHVAVMVVVVDRRWRRTTACSTMRHLVTYKAHDVGQWKLFQTVAACQQVLHFTCRAATL